MVIQCPECSTRYEIPEDRLGSTGKKMRCARCKNIFFASALSAEPAPEPVMEAPATSEPPPVSPEAEEAASIAPEAQTSLTAEDPLLGAFEEQETEDAEAGFDFSSFDTEAGDDFGTEAPALAPEDGFNDGFVREVTDDTEAGDATFDFAFGAEAVPNNVDPLLSELEEETESDEVDEAPVGTSLAAGSKRSPLSTVKVLILLLLLVILGGVAYLMVTDGVDAPMNFIQQILEDLT